MVTPYRDKGLDVLYDELHDAHPGMIIGWIGNKKHQGEVSDHNPSTEAHDKGAVDAIDPMLGPHYSEAQADEDVDVLVRSRDPRIAYIIWYGQIISSTVSQWQWRVYNGTDRHTNHWHLSVNDKHETDTSPWAIAERDDDMSAVDATNGFMAVLAQAANAALPAGDPNRAKDENGKELPTTQVGRNAVIFFRRILTPIMAADNDALIGAVLAKLPLGSMSSAQVEDALRSVLRDGVDG